MTDALYQPFPMEGVARAQIWRHARRYRRPRHFHPEPELNLIVAGRATFTLGESELAVSAGDLLWWAPGQDHGLVACSPDFDLFVIGASPELSDRLLGPDAGAALGGPTRFALSPAELARLREVCATPLSGVAATAERQIGELWREAHALRSSTPEKHALTRRALLSLMAEPELACADVARLARGHPSEVSRHFHADMRLTLTAYRTRLRLLRFVEAVDGGATSLLSAALDAGFGSYSQCHRAFHAALGCTPRAFFGSALRKQMGDTVAEEPPAAGLP